MLEPPSWALAHSSVDLEALEVETYIHLALTRLFLGELDLSVSQIEVLLRRVQPLEVLVAWKELVQCLS